MMNLLFAIVVLALVLVSQHMITRVIQGEMRLGYTLAVVVAPLTEEVGRVVCPLFGVLLGVFELVGYGTQHAIAYQLENGNSNKVAVVAYGVLQGSKNLLLHLGFTGVLLGLGGGCMGFATCITLHAANNMVGMLILDPPMWLSEGKNAVKGAVLMASATVYLAIALLGAYLYFW